MSTTQVPTPAADPQPKTHDVSWLIRVVAVLMPWGMVWLGCKSFVVQKMCVNGQHAWQSIIAMTAVAAILMLAQWLVAYAPVKQILFITQLLALVGVGIYAGMFSYAFWG